MSTMPYRGSGAQKVVDMNRNGVAALLIGTSWAITMGLIVVTPFHDNKPQLPTVPGAVNHTVTQRWICEHGTRTIRPPESYTNELKRTQIFALHLPGSPSDYEEDHLIPLSLGGAPFDARNLWPEPWGQAH
jgi:hypothetical protein